VIDVVVFVVQKIAGPPQDFLLTGSAKILRSEAEQNF
jgi:hypothetical protein